MKRDWFRYAVGVLAVVVILLSSVAFSVRQKHEAIVTRFGRPVRTLTEPGLHWKLPWPIDQAAVIDKRSRVINTRHSEMLTGDRKNIILMTYAVWNVGDALTFFRAVGNIEGADSKLDGLITNAQIGVLGQYELKALVSTNEADLKVDQIESEVLAAVIPTARDKYGIEIEYVGFKRLSLPEENIPAVFEQMRAERKSEAADFRAQGDFEASKVRSEADVTTAEIMADAREEAAIKKGQADAEAASIYATAHDQDPEFYRLWRSLNSLPKILGDGSTLILRTDSAPFGLLESRTNIGEYPGDEEGGD